MLIDQPLFYPFRSSEYSLVDGRCALNWLHNIPAHFPEHLAVPTISQSHICSRRDKNLVINCHDADRSPLRLCSHIAASESRSVRQPVLRTFHPCSTHLGMSSFSHIKVGLLSRTLIGTWTALSSLVSCKRNQIHGFGDASVMWIKSWSLKRTGKCTPGLHYWSKLT